MTQKLIGTSSTTFSATANGYIRLIRWQCSTTGICTFIKTYVKVSCNVRVAVYADNSGVPGSFLAESNSTAATANQYNDISLTSSVSMASGTWYWLAVQEDGANACAYNAASVSYSYKIATYGPFPNPISGLTNTTGYEVGLQGWGTTSLSITPSAIASAEAFGNPKLTLKIAPSGIPSAEAFGSPTIQHVVLSIAPAGIPTAEAFGVPTIKYPQVIAPTGIPSAEAFGSPSLYQGNISLVGIPSAEAFGVPVLTRYGVHVILEAEYFEESPQVNRAFVAGADLSGGLVSSSSITTAEAALVGERLEVEHNPAVTSATIAGYVAAAVLAKARLDGSKAKIIITPHCGVELWDVINIIDDLCDQSADLRVNGYTFEYDSKKAIYQHHLGFCTV